MIVCDIWAKQYEHYEFNKKILDIVSEKNEIEYFGDNEQIDMLELKKNIKFTKIRINKKCKLNEIMSYFYNLILIKKQKDKSIVILNGTPIIVILSRYILRNRKVYVFLHGLDRVIERKKVINFLFLKMLRKKCKDYKYIVLGENIKQNLTRIIPKLKERIFSIDHPYSFSKNNKNKIFNNKIRISTCGITAYEKGLNNIYEFIDKIESDLEFNHIGKSAVEVQDKYLEYFPYKNELISQEIYKKLIEELDYILILYPINSYKLTASGVYFDCIKFNKPLLGLRNEYFEYMFKKYGEIGKLFDSVDEIIEYLRNDRKILIEEQEIFWENMENIRENLNKNVERDLKRIIYQGEEK